MRWRRMVAVGGVLVLLGAGCSDDAGSTALSAGDTGATADDSAAEETSSSSDPSTTTTTSEATTTTESTTTSEAPPSDPSSDQATADAAVAAVATDLEGQGFTQVPPEDDSSDDDMPFTSPECEDFAAAFPSDDDDLPGQTAEAEVELQAGGVDPNDPEQSVEVNVAFVEDPSVLAPFLDLFEDQRLERCMQEAFTEGMAAGEEGPAIEIPDFRVERFDPAAGDRSFGLRMGGTFVMGTFEFPFILELELIAADRAAISIATGTFGGDEITVDGDTVRALVLDALAA